MDPQLRNQLLKAAGGGALVIAAVLGNWYEGTGPTVKQADGSIMYKPYQDTGKVWTVCRGVTGPQVTPTRLYSPSECASLESQHLKIAESAAKRLFKYYGTYSEWRKAALIDWLYNLGENRNTINSTLARDFNARNDAAGCKQLTVWIKGRKNGKLITLNGLVDRRGTGYELCMGLI